MIIPKSILCYPKGTIKQLLNQAYRLFHLQFPEYLDTNLKSFIECDSFFYVNPEIGEKCSFISEYKDHIVGMFCWDPRNYPTVTIGHNCILPTFQNLGLGKQQINIALKIFKEKGFKKAQVSTGQMGFFLPAQKMYTGAGFNELGRDSISKTPKLHDNIYYEMVL